MTPLSIHILTLNNENNIQKTIESLLILDAYINIIDLGSIDQTLSICNKLDVIIKKNNNSDYSKVRNDFVTSDKNDWQMYVEPGEILSSGYENIFEAIKESHSLRKLFVINGDLMTKEIRLWRKSSKSQFIYPTYETLQPDRNSKICNAFITSTMPTRDNLKILLDWKKREPQNTQPDYYLACYFLVNKKYSEFFRYANLYFFRETSIPQSVITLHYYCAMVELHYKRDVHECIRHIVFCLTEKPIMAEYWCVLGDALYKTGMIEQANEIFFNASILGQSRKPDDDYPIELSKYKDYPEKMMNLCNAIRSNNGR